MPPQRAVVRDREVEYQRPTLGRYLFVTLDLSRQRWRRVNGTRDIVRLLSFQLGASIARKIPTSFASRDQMGTSPFVRL